MLEIIAEAVSSFSSGNWIPASFLVLVAIIGHFLLKQEHDGVTFVGCAKDILLTAKSYAIYSENPPGNPLLKFILMIPVIAFGKLLTWLFCDFNRISALVAAFLFADMCHLAVSKFQPYISELAALFEEFVTFLF